MRVNRDRNGLKGATLSAKPSGSVELITVLFPIESVLVSEGFFYFVYLGGC